MKKYLFLLLIGAASLTACGDDDDPVVPELNKLTKVSYQLYERWQDLKYKFGSG